MDESVNKELIEDFQNLLDMDDEHLLKNFDMIENLQSLEIEGFNF
jgi:hypothetical protein